jgi:hypothetical protein
MVLTDLQTALRDMMTVTKFRSDVKQNPRF